MLKASLVIPTLERAEAVRALVASLDQQSTQDFETIIVDQSDAYDDALAALASKSPLRLQYLHITRKSLPNARNVAAAVARSPLLIFVDDDVTLSPNFVEAHVTHHQGSDPPACVAGRITGGYDDGPLDARVVGRYNPWLGVVTRNFHVTWGVQGIDQLPGGNFSVTRDFYTKAGGFDAEGFCGTASIGEETDFALRLRGAGGRIDFVPEAALVHLHLPMGGCRDRSITSWTYWHGHNMSLLARRHSGWYRMPVFVAAQFVRYIVHGMRRKAMDVTTAGWRGMFKGLFRVV